MRRFLPIATWFGLTALLLMGATVESPPTPEAPEPPDALDWVQEVRSLTMNAKPAAAVALCKARSVSVDTEPVEARVACAAALVKLADRLHLIGLQDKARAFWRHATQLDLTLLDQPDFMIRLRPLPPAAATPPAQISMSPGAAQPGALTRPPTSPQSGPGPPDAKAAKVHAPAGPRSETGLYLGLGAGYDGLGSLHLGWCHEERILLETSVGLVFPVVDTRVRILGWRRAITPYIGAGMTTPLARQDTLGIDLPAYENLYALGQTVHLDLGVSWAFHPAWETSGGAAFVTSLDGNDPNQIVFFPQVAFQLSYKL